MSNHELKHAYGQRLEAVMKILYDHDPDGIGRSIDTPADEYRDLATRLLPRLWAARTASAAGQEICKLFPSAEQTLIDALWAVRQRLV